MEQVARPERFELPTSWFVARRSIQLSYGRAVQSNVESRRRRRPGHSPVRSLATEPEARRKRARILP